MLLVVTGSGHNGTAWVARTLTLAGISATHEAIFTFEGRRPWPRGLEADVSLAATPHLDALGAQVAAVVVVRDPLTVVNSWLRGYHFADACPCHPGEHGAHRRTPFRRFVDAHVDLVALDELDAIARYVVAWHRLAVKLRPSVTVVRFEDLTDPTTGALRTLFDLYGLPARAVTELEAGGFLADVVNEHPGSRPPLTYPDLEADPSIDVVRLLDHATALGYR